LDQQENVDSVLVEEILNGVEVINETVYGCREYLGICFRKYADNYRTFSEQFEHWEHMLFMEVEYRKSLANKIDYDFQVLSAHISAMSEAALIEESLACLKRIRQDSEQNYEHIRDAYMHYHYFWGSLDLDNNNIELVENRIHEIKNQWEDFCWLYLI